MVHIRFLPFFDIRLRSSYVRLLFSHYENSKAFPILYLFVGATYSRNPILAVCTRFLPYIAAGNIPSEQSVPPPFFIGLTDPT